MTAESMGKARMHRQQSGRCECRKNQDVFNSRNNAGKKPMHLDFMSIPVDSVLATRANQVCSLSRSRC